MQKEAIPLNENIRQDRKIRYLLILLLLVTIVSVGVAIWALFIRDTTPALLPDYAPVEEEKNAEDIEEETDGEKMEVSQGGGAVSMTYQKSALVSLAGQSVKLMFQNPSKSVNDVALQLVIVSADGTETVIAQSGTIKPGKKVEQLDLIEDAATLSEGTYSGKFCVAYYAPDTAEKALVESAIEGVEITVGQ